MHTLALLSNPDDDRKTYTHRPVEAVQRFSRKHSRNIASTRGRSKMLLSTTPVHLALNLTHNSEFPYTGLLLTFEAK